MVRVGIIGAGVVGTAVGAILADRGYEVTGVYDILPESTDSLTARTGARVCFDPQSVSRSADVLFITTSDGAIEGVAREISEHQGFFSGQIVAHMSGALTSDVLRSAKDMGAVCVSMHPMQSFASVDRAIQNLSGSIFSIEGDLAAYDIISKVVHDLGGDYFFIDGKSKPLYHAGACVVSNYLVTLIEFGLQFLEASGLPRAKALKAFMPLIEGTISNVERIGIPKALTGPISRGDLSTVLKHLESMEEIAPQLTWLYSQLGYYTAEVARSKGTIDQGATEQFQQMFLRRMSRGVVRTGGE